MWWTGLTKVVNVTMARASSPSPEAAQRRRFSVSLSSVMREKRGGRSASSRADKLLGLSSPVHSSVLESDGVELEEEDVWEIEARGLAEGSPERVVYGHGGGSSHRADSSESYRLFNNGRRWLGLEKDPGLSVGFADSSRPVGLSALSPLKVAGTGQSMTRELTPGRISTAVRMIPPTGPVREQTGRHAMHQSAPMNVPDWSKILGAERKNKGRAVDLHDDDKEDGEEERVHPHVQVARQSQMTTFSVCEGQGRTLKGRDLSRVRNAVLRQTGFLDS